jgi:hypothetical protein
MLLTIAFAVNDPGVGQSVSGKQIVLLAGSVQVIFVAPDPQVETSGASTGGRALNWIFALVTASTAGVQSKVNAWGAAQTVEAIINVQIAQQTKAVTKSMVRCFILLPPSSVIS